MRRKRYLLLSLSLLVSSSASPAVLPETDPGEAIYDLYFRGIRTVELIVGPVEDESITFSIRRKNWRTDQWGTSASTTDDKIADDERFELPGALEKLPARLPAIGQIDWNAHEVVAWPDRTSFYLRNRVIESEIKGETVKATHWAMQDASRPIDLFKKGHRIRIAVMNALDNYYFPNSNTGGDEGTARHTVIGTMRIHHSADYPSHVSLPVLSH